MIRVAGGDSRDRTARGQSKRYEPDRAPFWVVLDPLPTCELVDVLFETTLRGLERQFKGELTMHRNPTVFTDRREAEL